MGGDGDGIPLPDGVSGITLNLMLNANEDDPFQTDLAIDMKYTNVVTGGWWGWAFNAEGVMDGADAFVISKQADGEWILDRRKLGNHNAGTPVGLKGVTVQQEAADRWRLNVPNF